MVVYYHNLAIGVVLQAQEITGCIVDDDFGVNMISETTYNRLDIKDWEACPFWLRMANTRFVRPLGWIQKLGIVVGGQNFEISAAVLALDTQGAYPILLGRAWL